ncbi:MAG: hypothetical protein RL266_572 [Bacteroidota bacterium]
MKYLFTALSLLLLVSVKAQVKVSDDTIHWNANRPLQWSDFKGEPTEGNLLRGQVLCMNLAGFQRQSAHHQTSFVIVSVFDRKNSWMPENERSDLGLNYFRVMFDIYELHSRKMRKEYADSRSARDPDVAFREKYSQSANIRTAYLDLFKKETKLGMDSTALETWRMKVQEELKALGAYTE